MQQLIVRGKKKCNSFQLVSTNMSVSLTQQQYSYGHGQKIHNKRNEIFLLDKNHSQFFLFHENFKIMKLKRLVETVENPWSVVIIFMERFRNSHAAIAELHIWKLKNRQQWRKNCHSLHFCLFFFRTGLLFCYRCVRYKPSYHRLERVYILSLTHYETLHIESVDC